MDRRQFRDIGGVRWERISSCRWRTELDGKEYVWSRATLWFYLEGVPARVTCLLSLEVATGYLLGAHDAGGLAHRGRIAEFLPGKNGKG